MRLFRYDFSYGATKFLSKLISLSFRSNKKKTNVAMEFRYNAAHTHMIPNLKFDKIQSKLLIDENFPFRSNTSTALTLYCPLVVKFLFVSGAKWYDINGTCFLIVMLIHLLFQWLGEKNISYVFVHLQYKIKIGLNFHTRSHLLMLPGLRKFFVPK